MRAAPKYSRGNLPNNHNVGLASIHAVAWIPKMHLQTSSESQADSPASAVNVIVSGNKTFVRSMSKPGKIHLKIPQESGVLNQPRINLYSRG